MNFIKKYLLSLDFIIAILCTALCLLFLPDFVSMKLSISLLEMGIGVLSITFGIFFAAMAFIMGSGDDEFVSFLQELNVYKSIISSFKFTVFTLFFALFYSIITFIIVSFCEDNKSYSKISEYVIAVFCFLFFYSLIATALSTLSSIRYSESRVKFLELKNKKRHKA